MNLIECQDVDLIMPFPVREAHRVYGWMHCYKTICETDSSPKTKEDFETWMQTQLSNPNLLTFGVIDKNNKLNLKHPAPLIGIVMFERAGETNGYLHCVSSRKAWGSGFMDQALRAVITAVFKNIPELLRVSSMPLDKNFPAKAMARRMGGVFEGRLDDMCLQDGEPVAVVHFGITRRNWQNQQQQLTEAVTPSVSPEIESELVA